MNIISLKFLAILFISLLNFTSCEEQDKFESQNPEIDRLFDEWNKAAAQKPGSDINEK